MNLISKGLENHCQLVGNLVISIGHVFGYYEVMYKGNRVSVVIPTYKEKDSIYQCLRGFELEESVDEIIVVNNNAESGTSNEIDKTSAIEIMENNQGYGAAIKRGIAEASGELIVICEPDGTFIPSDLNKLLPFTDECSLVMGSRTVNTFIWDGANMGIFLKWGNWFVAKLIEILFNTGYQSDVGCTFRIIDRNFIQSVDLQRLSDDGKFGLEMQLVAVLTKTRMVQVPVNYKIRVGQSSYTGNFRGSLTLGLKMILTVLQWRIKKPKDLF
jgi:glycosyltransferase involved in cell wall biosynthesis